MLVEQSLNKITVLDSRRR